MTQKPQLSFWQIWNMCFGFLGIQMGFALQNANVSRIFQTLGASIEDIPILWIAAPVTGLLVQPVIGYMSDRTWNRLGRRRPYFLAGAILSTLALFFMPNTPALWIAAGTLWIMDASINVSMEPFRAFVGDMLPNEQRTLGFAMQSFFIGIGAIVASALPWMMANWFDVSNVAAPGVVPDSVKFSFYIGGAALFVALLWTVLSTREYPPEQLEQFDHGEGSSDSVPCLPSGTRSSARYYRDGTIWIVAGLVIAAIVANWGLDKQLYILGFGGSAFGLIQCATAWLQRRERTSSGFYEIVDDMFHMPRTMAQLALVQFFSWFALFAMWIYSNPAVTAYHFNTSDTSSALYNEGANWVGVLFAAYNGFAALFAFLIPVMARLTSRKGAHMINLALGGLGLLSFILIRDPDWLILPMLGVGIAWASILSMPYAILSGSLPAAKMGVYMGIFNFFIVIPQLLAASILGFLLRVFFDGDAIYALVMAGVSLILASATVWLVDDPGETASHPHH